MIHDANEFSLVRGQLLCQTNVHQHQSAALIAQTTDFNNFTSNIDRLVRARLLKRRNRANSIITHYMYEKRFHNMDGYFIRCGKIRSSIPLLKRETYCWQPKQFKSLKRTYLTESFYLKNEHNAEILDHPLT